MGRETKKSSAPNATNSHEGKNCTDTEGNSSALPVETHPNAVTSARPQRVSLCLKFAVVTVLLVHLWKYLNAEVEESSLSESVDNIHLRSSSHPLENISLPPALQLPIGESDCYCKAGAMALGNDGKCHAWCSKHGYCGSSHKHISGGKDCRTSASGLRANATSSKDYPEFQEGRRL